MPRDVIYVRVPGAPACPESWEGWRFTEAGRYLVSPDGQHITRERLHGLLLRDAAELRRAGFESRRRAEAGRPGQGRKLVKVIVVDLDEYRMHGRAAG